MATYIYEPSEEDLQLRSEDLEIIQVGWDQSCASEHCCNQFPPFIDPPCLDPHLGGN